MSQYNLPEAFNRSANYAAGVVICGSTLISNAGSGSVQLILIGAIGAVLTYAGFKVFAQGLQVPEVKAEPAAAASESAPAPKI